MRIKKLLSLLLIAASATLASAQGTGTWVTHPQFALNLLQNVVDTRSKVYYVVGNRLYCFNKATHEHKAFSRGAGLTGTIVTGIYYNAANDFLVVTYDDSNIDILTADGRVTGVPAIKDLVSTRDKTINDVTFGAGRIYVATACGYLVLDDSTFTITKAATMVFNLTSTATMGKWLLISYANGYIYYTPANNPVDNINYAPYTKAPKGIIRTVNDSTFLLLHSWGLIRYTATPSGSSKLTFRADTLLREACNNLQATPSGFIVNSLISGYYYTLDAQGANPNWVNGGKELWSAAPGGDGTLWGLGASGMHSSAAPGTYYKPNAISLTGIPFYMTYNYAQKKLYVGNLADNILLTHNVPDYQLELNTFDGHDWADVTPSGTEVTGYYNFVFDPADPSMLWTSGRYGRITRLNTVTGQMTHIDMKYRGGVMRRAGLTFDPQGNLFIAQSSLGDQTANSLFILPKDKLHQASYATSDFITLAVPHMKEFNSFKGIQFVALKKSPFLVFSNGDFEQDIFFIRNDNTSSNFQSKNYHSLTDAAGRNLTWIYVYDMAVNPADKVAIATSDGFFITDPTKALTDDFTCISPSYFSGMKCNAVAADAQGNWWVGTNENGLYHISSDGATILQHFTTANSGLCTDCIYSLCPDTVGGSLFMATPLGVQQYWASTPAQDLCAVKVSPNPVSPAHTGLITITGLTEGCTVVIKDALGTVVARLSATAGQAVWDGCGPQGERLPTGRYGVFAVTAGSQLPSQPQATVMLIK